LLSGTGGVQAERSIVENGIDEDGARGVVNEVVGLQKLNFRNKMVEGSRGDVSGGSMANTLKWRHGCGNSTNTSSILHKAK
jgi:hypothetical protein